MDVTCSRQRTYRFRSHSRHCGSGVAVPHTILALPALNAAYAHPPHWSYKTRDGSLCMFVYWTVLSWIDQQLCN